VLPGIFIIAATLSLAIGTSMGTLAAVLPIAIGLADATGLDRGMVLGAVVGGAMFGDNLSVISDTTIAATRSQGAAMGDKFRENLAFALPAALATVVILALLGSPSAVQVPEAGSPWLALPYLLVLVLALLGMEVLRVLGIGLLAALLAGLLLTPGFGLLDASGQAYAGMQGMLDTLLVSVLVGGLAALAQAGGALSWLAGRIALLARGRRSPRAGQVAIAALAAGTDAATANNTVAILVAGPLARELASTHGITPRRSAALLDIAACVVQGLMPYSAQILVAASLGAVSPLALVTQVHYCWLLGLALVVGLLLPPKPAPAPAIAAER
jgi:Na+/H+ antiporter NhaC